MTSARDLIMGTSSPAMAFTYPNDAVAGKIITEPKAVQQTVYDPRNPQSKELAFWPSGDPKMQVIFQVQTEFRNHEGIKNPDRSSPDNGARTIYLKGKHMERATAEAVRAAGADWLDVGGLVYYRYIGEDMTSLAGVKPKLFEVRYQKPAAQPPQHLSQPQGGQGYPNQGYGQQQPPQSSWAQHQGRQDVGDPYATTQAQPNWQQAGWTSQAQQTVPSHHGQPDQMPAWANSPTSAPPAPTSGPPAPALSTLDLIKQNAISANLGQSGSPESGQVDPTF